MANKNIDYNNESITMLKGPDKVRKRPGVIFGSDGLDGCEHSVFEIISNSIDEARSGFGNNMQTTQLKLKISGVAVLLIIINRKTDLTGNLCTVKCMQGENIMKMIQIMNIPLV